MHKRQVLVVTVGSGEITSSMVKRLSQQIQHGLKVSGLRCGRITYKEDYILIDTPDEVEVAEAIAGYPGIHYTAVVEGTSSRFDDVVNLAFQVGRKAIYPDETFKVSVSHSGRFEYTARDVEVAASARLIGELAQMGARLDEVKPSKTVHVKIGKSGAYVFHYRFDGPGGLPVGSRGRAVCLLTGDRRSGVASWLAVRGGLMPHFLIYDLRPFTTNSHLKSALSITLRLRELIPAEGLELSLVKQSDALERLKSMCPMKMLPIILKRMLIRVACLYAEKLNLDIVVAGEGLSKDPFWLLKALTDTATSLRKHLILPTLALTDREIADYAKNVRMVGEDRYSLLEVRSGLREIPLSSVKEMEASLEVDRLIEEVLKNVYRRRLDVKNIDLHRLLNDMP